MTVVSHPTVTESERREAMEAVLGSATLSRSAQLRAFLRYVCEMELAGRGHELTENQIGVEVLGRGKDFGLAEDSTVRNRAYELRQRLEKFYSTECPHANIRIEIPRGCYVPVYVRMPDVAASATKPDAAVVATTAPAVIPVPADGADRAVAQQFRSQKPWLAAAGIGILCVAAGWIAGSRFGAPRKDAVLLEAWGPLASPGEDLLICIATNLHMIVRPHIAPHPRRYPAPAELLPVYSATHPSREGDVLYMEPALLSVPLAELAASVTLANARASLGGSVQILPESEAPAAALRDRNAVLIGTSVNSQAAAALLRGMPLNIVFNAEDRFALVDTRKPAGQNEIHTVQPGSGTQPSVLYGLLTVISGTDSTNRPKRQVIISGAGSAGVQAVAEFFSSPARMAEMKERFTAAGIRGFPASYQVVVRCKTYGLRLMSYDYEMHAVIQK
jgi:hypothetical protein